MKSKVPLLAVAAVATLGVIAAAWWWYPRYASRSALLEQPVYRVLEKHDRALFDKLLARYRQYRGGKASREEFTNFASGEISAAATTSLAHASQASVLALVSDMLATARKLQATSGDACFRFWFPDVAGPPEVASAIDAQSQAKTLELTAEVIRSAAEQPTPLPDPEAVKDDLARIVNGVYEQFGTDAQMLAHAADARADRTKVCTITISLYERILQLPPEQASNLIRTMAPPADGA